jgi:hypothetical protein
MRFDVSALSAAVAGYFVSWACLLLRVRVRVRVPVRVLTCFEALTMHILPQLLHFFNSPISQGRIACPTASLYKISCSITDSVQGQCDGAPGHSPLGVQPTVVSILAQYAYHAR